MLVIFRQGYIFVVWWGEWVFIQVLVYIIVLLGVFYVFVLKDNFFSWNLKWCSCSWKFILVFVLLLFVMFLFFFINYGIFVVGYEFVIYNCYEYIIIYKLKICRKGCYYCVDFDVVEGLILLIICIIKCDYDLMVLSGKIEVVGYCSMWGFIVIVYWEVFQLLYLVRFVLFDF